MSKLTKALTAAAGNAGGGALYVEDVFSTYLYTGTGSDININNGIDLAGEGGMVWFKTRSTANAHNIYDTERGNGKLQYITTEPTYTNTTTPWNPTSTGFNTGRDFGGSETQNGSTTVSWTFRKAEKFFDVVTYTGSTGPVAHNLGSVPKLIMIKAYSGTYATNDWMVYHANVGAPFLNLNDSGAAAGSFWTTSITDTHFTPPGNTSTNGNGTNYVAYLFASDAGGFGDDGSENIIKCGSFTTDGSGSATVDLGFEPQWLLVKNTQLTENWVQLDNMRGWSFSSQQRLFPNLSNAEQSLAGNYGTTAATGFNFVNGLANSNTYIYIAIRRPMKTPESGTEVFKPSFRITGDPTVDTGFVTDMGIVATRTGGGTSDYHLIGSRLTGNLGMTTTSSSAEVSRGLEPLKWDYNDGWGGSDTASSFAVWYSFKRATGFFDVVAYTGGGSSVYKYKHNLGVAPELIIIKSRSNGTNVNYWPVKIRSVAGQKPLALNSAAENPLSSTSYWSSFTDTATEFATRASSSAYDVNATGYTYIAYLFASVAGVSKVGSYTGTGSNVDVDCGFSAGARFILIKRTDSTGDWYVWDSVRGIVAGNDPYLLLNSTAAEVTSTDYIDPLASGFTVTSSAPAALNASGGTYIFLAIA